jgi:hypothetical protein
MQDTEVLESARSENRGTVPVKRRAFSVRFGKLVPPKERSAKIKGEGYITFVDNTLSIDGVNENGTNVILFTVIATLVAYAVMIPIQLTSELPGLTTGFVTSAVTLISYPIFKASLRKGVMLTIDTNTPKAYYMQKRGIACLELPDGRWVAVRCIDAEVPALLEHLKAAYRDRLSLGK